MTSPSPSILEDYLSESEAASQLRKTPRTLQRWRQQRQGPAVTYIGRNPYYQRSSIQQWLATLERPMVRERKRSSRKGRARQ